jgi:hypothetical protein
MVSLSNHLNSEFLLLNSQFRRPVLFSTLLFEIQHSIFDIYVPQASLNSLTTSDLSFVAAPLRRMDKQPSTIFGQPQSYLRVIVR